MSDNEPRQDVVPADYAAGAALPWWSKMAAKLAIAALRVPPGLLRRMGVNRHSFVAEAESRVLGEPCTRAQEFAGRHGRPPRGVLELGPGRLVVRAPAYAGLGCAPIWFADVEDDAPTDPAAYRRVAALARGIGLPAPALEDAATKEAALAACDARQLIGGTEVLAAIPDGSIELIVSDVVLEHVRRDALPGLLAELRRVAAPECLGVHAVDFHDHIGGALNTLRFPPALWESPLVARSGLYVNRLGLSEILAAFEAAGFTTGLTDIRRWPAAPAGAAAAHPALRRGEDDNLVAFARIRAEPA
ncbi:hypothetical protein [Muricoccus vinaceus]|uniref:Methyltransferase type 11 domain-containing protein n=1 Tax=Muricoccus vinaceus TaxID=424704 RepID=A0ABV6IQ52_9PROT